MTNILSYETVPTVCMYLSSSVSNVTGNGTAYTILFDSIVSGFSSSGYNTGTGIYTVPVTGNYFICTSFKFTNIINGANGNLSTIVNNVYTSRISEYSCTAAKSPSNTFCVNGNVVLNLTAGNTVSINAQLNNGSAASVGIAGGTSPYLTWLFIKYLG
jgi:hypothetical protein